MSLRIEVKGLERLREAARLMPQRFKDGLDAFLEAIAEKVRLAAQLRIHSRTGSIISQPLHLASWPPRLHCLLSCVLRQICGIWHGSAPYPSQVC